MSNEENYSAIYKQIENGTIDVYQTLLGYLYDNKIPPLPVLDRLLKHNSSGIEDILVIALNKKYPEAAISHMLTFITKENQRDLPYYDRIASEYPDLVEQLLEQGIIPEDIQWIKTSGIKISPSDMKYILKMIKENNKYIYFDDIGFILRKGYDDEILKSVVQAVSVASNYSYDPTISKKDSDVLDALHAKGFLLELKSLGGPLINYMLKKRYDFYINENTVDNYITHVENEEAFLTKIQESGIKQKDPLTIIGKSYYLLNEELIKKILDISEPITFSSSLAQTEYTVFGINLQKLILERVDSHIINQQAADGNTVLFNVISRAFVRPSRETLDKVKLLIEKGADPTIKNAKGMSPKRQIYNMLPRQSGLSPIFEACLRKTHGLCSVDLEEEDVYQFHEHAAGEEICARALTEHMKAQAAEGNDNGLGEDRVVPCYIAECPKKITSDDALGIVADDFYRSFYILGGMNARPNTGPFNAILENTPRGNTGEATVYGQNYHKSFCPICMVMVERTHGCAYMYHECKDYLKSTVLEEKYKKKRPVGEKHISMWCVVCGRPSAAHRHLTAEGEFAPEKPREEGVHIYAACNGGGRAEMFARLLMIRAVLASYPEEELAKKNYESAIVIRRACLEAADGAYLDEGLMARGAELAALEAGERLAEFKKGGRKTRKAGNRRRR